jgi:cytochrome c oxidase subunit 2
VVAFAALFLLALAGCDSPQNTFSPRSDVADSIMTVYVLVTVLASIVGFAVLVAMVWLIVKFRARPGVQARQIHGNNKLEIAWTIAPVLVLIMIAVPTMFWIAGTSEEPGPDALRIEATGHQWWFEFRYPGLGPDGGDLVTANELVLPVGRQVAVTLHSDDVIHSFWVPELVGKTDMIPGRTNHLTPFTPYEPGIYYGQCAEFCGSAHALMRFRVVVQTASEFNQWVDAYNTPPTVEPGSAAERGQQAFAACAACHTIAGTPAGGTLGPNLTLFGERHTLAAGVLDNTEENLKAWITDVRQFKPIPDQQRFMPTFEGRLTEGQISDIAAYLRSLTIE